MAGNPPQLVPSEDLAPASPEIMLAATFTVDPLIEPVSFLLYEAGLHLPIEVAPYAQVFQQLLDPASRFAHNRDGVNVLLVRFEDWWRGAHENATVASVDKEVLKKNVADLALALKESARVSPAPIVLCVCPPSASAAADEETKSFLCTLADRLHEAVVQTPSVLVLSMDWAQAWEPSLLHDPEGDRLGNVPYTRRFFAALGIEIARVVHDLKSPPIKVLVLDCDETLWGGVVGEDGLAGIELTPRYLNLQRLVLEKKQKGMLLCLASKNNEADVLDVFEQRKDMLLRREDIVGMRVNWLPKSQNIQALADELNLGLDSFAFIDDNPVECAEVEAGCPGVLVLSLADVEDPARYLGNVWPLDVLNVTEEDRRRSEMVRDNLARDRLAKSVGDLASFLAALDLRVDIAEPRMGQLARVAQLTQRTNQFNFTTRRRSEPEIEQLLKQGLECRVVEVQDRFGDYGLVGVVIFSQTQDAMVLDTFLLSCRVLGRGVEHAIIRELGTLARGRGLGRIEIPFAASKKNTPARRFLGSIEAQEREAPGGGALFTLSVDQACGLTHTPESESVEIAGDTTQRPSSPPQEGGSRSKRWNWLARTLESEEKLLASLESNTHHARTSSELPVMPKNETERKLCTIWCEVLGLDEVGIHDDYVSDLGGTSLMAVTLFARIEREMGVHLPLSALVETPTIAGIASLVDRPCDRRSLVLLHAGGPAVPLFLVHDADGETLLYRNLAQRLGDRSVYGIQPHGRPEIPITHTRICDMAAHYVGEIRKIRPQGPYLLGGLCAGGVVAYEMALQFEDLGESAKLVAVFDAAAPEAERRPNLENQRRLARIRLVLGDDSPARVVRTMLAKVGNYAAFQLQNGLKHVWDRAAVASLRICLDQGLPLPPWARRLDVRSVYNVAEAEYRPGRPLREEILLFRASEGEGSEEPYVRLYVDPMLGWGQRSQRGARAFDVPGGHGSMLQEPNVAVLAEILRSYLGHATIVPSGASA
jgi:FkbH-like protein